MSHTVIKQSQLKKKYKKTEALIKGMTKKQDFSIEETIKNIKIKTKRLLQQRIRQFQKFNNLKYQPQRQQRKHHHYM